MLSAFVSCFEISEVASEQAAEKNQHDYYANYFNVMKGNIFHPMRVCFARQIAQLQVDKWC